MWYVAQTETRNRPSLGAGDRSASDVIVAKLGGRTGQGRAGQGRAGLVKSLILLGCLASLPISCFLIFTLVSSTQSTSDIYQQPPPLPPPPPHHYHTSARMPATGRLVHHSYPVAKTSRIARCAGISDSTAKLTHIQRHHQDHSCLHPPSSRSSTRAWCRSVSHSSTRSSTPHKTRRIR